MFCLTILILSEATTHYYLRVYDVLSIGCSFGPFASAKSPLALYELLRCYSPTQCNFIPCCESLP